MNRVMKARERLKKKMRLLGQGCWVGACKMLS
jgi:hypothetical protein